MEEALVPVRGEDLGGDGKLAGERTSDLAFEIGRNTQIRIVAAAVVSVFSRPQRITIAVRAFGLVQPASVVEIRTGLRADETRFCIQCIDVAVTTDTESAGLARCYVVASLISHRFTVTTVD